MLYYSVAHYYDVDIDTHYKYGTARGKNKYKNIESHINVLKKLDIKDKAFVITSTINAEKGDKRYEEVKNELYNFCKKLLPNNEIYVIVTYNWGGTIAALWNAYKLLKGKEGYLAHFEEDFGPLNTKWYKESIKLLDNNTIYIGESNIGRIKKETNRGNKPPNQLIGLIPEVWTDGGYYFSTLDRLEKIEEKIGIFHKGDQNKKYTNLIDGIDLGEVGFPTLLYHADLKFNCLLRSKYFNNEWNDN
tara:strand:+ start:1037 stop:1774 length:738 start_codon:yes stop_codon:yes gene_type:complete